MDFSTILWDLPGSGIEQESFRRIDSEVLPEKKAKFTAEQWHVARRLVHTGADFAILDILEMTPDAVQSGLKALHQGRGIYTDSNMIKAGLSVPKLQKFDPAYTRESILCPVADPEVAEYAKAHGITRALAAVELHKEFFRDCIFLCGNAPLALAGPPLPAGPPAAAEHGVRPGILRPAGLHTFRAETGDLVSGPLGRA